MDHAFGNHTAVITGASTGIGQACALHLDKKEWRVFAWVRKESDGTTLKQRASDRLTAMYLDVTNAESILLARQTVADAVGPTGLSGLVNNAGIPLGGPLEFLDTADVRRQLDVNVIGVIAVTQAFLPLLRLGRGRIVNMSSISGRIALPFLSPYAASKFALEAISDSLRVELGPWGISVSVVEPGDVATPVWEKSLAVIDDLLKKVPPQALELYGSIVEPMRALFKPHGIAPEQVAQIVAHALTARRPRTRYLVGQDAKVLALLALLPDRIRDWTIARRLRYG
jgi:NAD(P)-dependent dehydrogenase (short-subunit alcohol dehydrogenase family)